jgi:hypothetical protein
MVLDHLIVESLDNNEEKLDVQALLLHGLGALFDDKPEKDIKYDDNDIENLLDRSKLEETIQQPTEDKDFGSFKTARIWANSTARLEDLEDEPEDLLDTGYWDRIIKERVRIAEAAKRAEAEQSGRGKRRAATKKVIYFKEMINFRLTIPYSFQVLLNRVLKLTKLSRLQGLNYLKITKMRTLRLPSKNLMTMYRNRRVNQKTQMYYKTRLEDRDPQYLFLQC